MVLEGVNETYKIVVSINAQCDIEDLTGESLFETLAKPTSQKLLRNVFMIGLRYGEGKKVNAVKAGEYMADIIEAKGFPYFEAKIQEAIAKGLGIDENAEEIVEDEGK